MNKTVIILAIVYFFGATITAFLMKRVTEFEEERKISLKEFFQKCFLKSLYSWPLQIIRMHLKQPKIFQKEKKLKRVLELVYYLFLSGWFAVWINLYHLFLSDDYLGTWIAIALAGVFLIGMICLCQKYDAKCENEIEEQKSWMEDPTLKLVFPKKPEEFVGRFLTKTIRDFLKKKFP